MTWKRDLLARHAERLWQREQANRMRVYHDDKAEWPIENWMAAYDAGRVRRVVVSQAQGDRPRVSWSV